MITKTMSAGTRVASPNTISRMKNVSALNDFGGVFIFYCCNKSKTGCVFNNVVSMARRHIGVFNEL